MATEELSWFVYHSQPLEVFMGDVVDMTGRVIESTEPIPLGTTLCARTPEERQPFGCGGRQQPPKSSQTAKVSTSTTLICLIQPLLVY